MQYKKFFLTEYMDGDNSPWSASATDYIYPSEDFVVAYLDDGKAVTFADNSWPLQGRHRNISQRSIIHLRYKGEPSDINGHINLTQSKSILLALDLHSFKSPGTPLGIESLNRYNLALQRARMYCHKNNLTIFQALASADHAKGVYELCVDKAKSNAVALEDLLPKLSRLPFRYLGFKPTSVKFCSPPVSVATDKNQTLLIPTKIYLDFLLGYREKITSYMKHGKRLEELALAVSRDHKYGRGRPSETQETFQTALDRFSLTNYAAANNILCVKDLLGHFGLINYCSAMLIYAFTGMRRSELYSLTLNSLKLVTKDRIVISRGLHGFTTKLHGRKKAVVWYTSSDIELPFTTASHVCKTIIKCNGLLPKNQCVFISTAYFPFSNTILEPETIDTQDAVAGNYEPSRFQRRISTPTITATDIAELSSVDPLRNWTIRGEISSGNPWPLSIHQLRRSTAVYSIRSGMVTLPALKSMLKHITIEMTKYYSRGSIYAPDILKAFDGNKDSIVALYQESERYVAAWQYANEVLMPDEKLFGGHGTWADVHTKKAYRKMNYVERFEETLKRVNKGQLSYRATPLGGCTSNKICNKRITVDLLGCDGCASAVVRKPKLIKLIALQTITVESCDKGTMEHTAEMQTLHELSNFASRLGIQQ